MNHCQIAEQVKILGAHRAAIIPLSQVCFDKAFRKLCESNSCGMYGKAGCVPLI